MRQSSIHAADTRAAQAALARPALPELDFDRLLLVDDSDEDATQILTMLTERTGTSSHTFRAVVS